MILQNFIFFISYTIVSRIKISAIALQSSQYEMKASHCATIARLFNRALEIARVELEFSGLFLILNLLNFIKEFIDLFCSICFIIFR